MKQAAAYVRMSTEHQKYSIENQLSSIRQYCEKHELDIARVYSDAGISGLTFESRPGLRSLVHDAETGAFPYDFLVVLDVSRWGRFQNVDEGAYYEHLLLRSGVRMIYCAEPFENDDTPITTIIKSLKRAMAAEFSRELSRKVSAGKRRVASKGFRSGGCPGYGYRRVILGRDGQALRVAEKGDWGAAESGRTTLQLGPPQEVAAVRRMFHLFAVERLRLTEVAEALAREGYPPPNPGGWTLKQVASILANEKYCGTVVFGRVTQFLSTKRQAVDPADWLRVPNAHPAIVSEELFRLAAKRRARSRREWSRDELIKGLKDLFGRYGTVTRALIDASDKLPSAASIKKAFGAFSVAYAEAGLPEQSVVEKRLLMEADRLRRNGGRRPARHRLRGGSVAWETVLTEAQEEGLTLEALAARTQISPETVVRRAREFGVMLRRAPRARRVNWAYEFAQAEGNNESIRDVATRLGYSRSHVDKARARLGVRLKPDQAPPGRHTNWPVELRRARRAGETPAQMARRLGVARQTTANAARRWGILLKGQHGGPA